MAGRSAVGKCERRKASPEAASAAMMMGLNGVRSRSADFWVSKRGVRSKAGWNAEVAGSRPAHALLGREDAKDEVNQPESTEIAQSTVRG